MINKIKSFFTPKKWIDYVEEFRKKFIPKRYNQIKLMEYLLDEDVDHYISISNRTDGKSFNYIHFILNFCLENNIGFTFVVRKFTVRIAGQKIIQKILDSFDHFESRYFAFHTTQFYTIVIYKDRQVGIITDLKSATDLKYQSNFLQDFPIIIYDEFLALEGDYLPDEWDRLKTIYSSINRVTEIPIIKIPKIIYLGNAVNFSSPILASLNLFNILEKHQMDTVKKYGNIVLEFNDNEKANDDRNLRAFNEYDDDMTYAKFTVNYHNIATEHCRNLINQKPNYVYIKLRENYLKVSYNRDTLDSILSIVTSIPSDRVYEYNTNLKDNIEHSIYCKETYYDLEHTRKYNQDYYLFDNMYTKEYILDNYSDLTTLRINKIITEHNSNNDLDNFEMRERVYKENAIENTKKYLFNKFHGY